MNTRRPMRRCVGLLVLAGVAASCTGGGQEPASSEAVPTSTASSGVNTAPDPNPESEPESESESESESDFESELPRLPDIEPEPWEAATRSEELAVELGEVEEITPQMAVDIIGLTMPDLSGQTPTDLPPGDGLGDYTPLRLAHSMRGRFSAAQQVVIDEYLDAGELAATITPDGVMTLSDQQAPPTSISGFRRPATEPFDQYPIILESVWQRWDAHLPDHPGVAIEMSIVPLGTKNTGGGLMDAHVEEGVCEIRVWPLMWADETWSTPVAIAFVFAHEMFHCFQGRWQGSGPNPQPGWLIEGGADWAAADLYRDEPTSWMLERTWFDHATPRRLEARNYDAWPLWEHAHDMRRDVYGAMRTMVPTPTLTTAELLYAGGLDGLLFRSDWDTSSFQQPTWSEPWFLSFPEGDIPARLNDPQIIDGGGVGERIIHGQGDWVHAPFFVDMEGVDLVSVTPIGGPLTTRASIGTVNVAEGETGYFCFADHQCACPGAEPAGVPMISTAMMFSFAVNETAGLAHVRAEEWDDDQCDRPVPAPSGHSNGDPHLRTFDGLPYDVVTLGEFVLARDPDGDLEVQTRHEPVGAGAGTTAVAIGTGGHRLTFTMPALDSEAAPTVLLDGTMVDGADVDVGEARASLTGTMPSISWPDGTVVQLRWFFGWFVSIETRADRAGRMVGLLGSADGDLTNDLELADGTFVDTSDAARDESPFVLQWAVDDDSTLFDYLQGESPATFRVPHPGDVELTFDPAATAACTDALGPLALSDEVAACAYDVSVTGVGEYVTVYSDVVDERAADDVDLVVVPDTPPSAPPTDGVSGRTGEPTITLGGDTLAGAIEARAGSVLLARIELCPEGGLIDMVVQRTDTDDDLARATLCDSGAGGSIGAGPEDDWFNGEAYVWLPDDATYEVVIDPVFGDAVGAVDIYTDPSPTVVTAEDLGTGGDERHLEGIGDTIVYITDTDIDYSTEGLQTACAVEVWSGRGFPDTQPFNLVRCEHTDTIHFTPVDWIVPIVVFARTDGRQEIRLTPA